MRVATAAINCRNASRAPPIEYYVSPMFSRVFHHLFAGHIEEIIYCYNSEDNILHNCSNGELYIRNTITFIFRLKHFHCGVNHLFTI